MKGFAYEQACIEVLIKAGFKPVSITSQQRARLVSQFEPKFKKVASEGGLLVQDLSDRDILDYAGVDFVATYRGWPIGIDFTLKSDTASKERCGKLIKKCLSLDFFVVYNGDVQDVVKGVRKAMGLP